MLNGRAHRSTDSVTELSTLPSIPTSINGASYHVTDAKSPHERLIASLVNKIRNQLPHHSGRTILQLETDQSLQHVVETLVDAGKERLDRVAWSLTELTHNVFKATQQAGGGASYMEHLTSLLYVLKVLCTAMARHWDAHTNMVRADSAQSGPKQRVWSTVDPPAIDQSVAMYILSVVLLILRDFHVLIRRPRVGGHTRTGTITDFDVYNLRGAQNDTARVANSLYPFTSYRFDYLFEGDTGVKASPREQIPASAFDLIGTSFHHSNSPVTYKWLIQAYAARVIFQLSCSNWSVVLAKIRQKIRQFADRGVDDRSDVVDIYIIKYSAPTRKKLIAIMQELSSLLINMRREAWTATAGALRTALRNWARFSPREAHDIIAEKIRFDGTTERLFDQFLAMTREDNTSKFSLWPVLVPLLAVSPDRLSVVSAASYTGIAQRSNFLTTMVSSLTLPPTASTELATGCLMDFCKGAAVLSPDLQSMPLYIYATDLAGDLHGHFFRYNQTPDENFKNYRGRINVALCCDLLFVIYRYQPTTAMEAFPLCLAPERTDAVKLSVVDAFVTIIVESRKYPWFKSIDVLYQFAPMLRQNFSKAVQQYVDDEEMQNLMEVTTHTVSDDWASDPTLSEREYLILSTLTLNRLEYRMVLTGYDESETLPEDLAKCFRPTNHRTIRLAMAKTCMAFMTNIVAALSAPPGPDIPEVLKLALSINARLMKEHVSHLLENERLLPFTDPLDMIILHALLGFSIFKESCLPAGAHPAFNYVITGAEFVALMHLAYYRTDYLYVACEVLGLIARSEEQGVTRTGRYLTTDQARERVLLYKEFYKCSQDPSDSEMRHTRIRAAIRRLSFPFQIYAAAWREIHRQWKGLVTDARVISDTASITTSAIEQRTATWDDWRNVTLYLAATLSSCLTRGETGVTVFPHKDLPARLHVDHDLEETVDRFLDALVQMLVSNSTFQRETALEAVCFELDPSFYPKLLFKLDGSISVTFNHNQSDPPPWEEPHKTYAVQYTLVLKSIFDRMDVGPGALPSVDLTRMLQCLVRYLDGSSNNVLAFRIKTKFVYMVESFLSRAKWLPPRKENFLRNVLLIFISGWTSDSIPYQAIHAQQNHETIHELDLACLRCISQLTATVELQPVDNITSALDTIHVRARLFHRQLGFFMVVLERWLRNRHLKKDEIDVLKLLAPMSPEDETRLWDYSVQGIVNLLENNTHAGLAEALSFCYHEEPDIRSIFVTIFGKALERSVKLSSAKQENVGERHSYICEALKAPDLLLALSVIENCPSYEIDEKCQMLLNVFNTRRTLLPLLKAAIDHEVERSRTGEPLFRSNDMRNILLTGFCKKYGAGYLRSMLARLLKFMADHPDQSYGIDSKLLPGSNTFENIEVVKKITRAFLDVILDSVDNMPPMIREVCAYLAHKVGQSGGTGSRDPDVSQAIGVFIFLRFICPAIVNPSKVDVELPPNSKNIQRGLLLVTKIIQNLANNTRFKEGHMAPFNPFLEENIRGITQFMNAILERPRDDPDENELITVPYEEVDHMMAHQFFSSHADAVGLELFRLRGIFLPRKSNETAARAKVAWDDICSILVDLGPVTKYPSLTKASGLEHPRYNEFVLRNAARDVKTVVHLFYELPTERDESTSTFIFHINQVDVELIEPSVLSIHILQMLATNNSRYFKILLDCSKFSSTCDIPVPWITEFFDVIPFDQLSQLVALEILNPNRMAQGFLRKARHLFMGFSTLTVIIDVTLSQSENFLEQHPDLLMAGEEIFDLGPGLQPRFCDALMFDELNRPLKVDLTFEAVHLRVTTVDKEPLFADIKSQLTEYLDYHHVHDITRSKEHGKRFILHRGDDQIVLQSDDHEQIVKALHIAKARTERAEVQKLPRPRILVDDTTAILLNIGLVNMCHPVASVRNSALGLVCAVAGRVQYTDPMLLKLRNGFLPAHPSAFACRLSDKIARSAPELTLHFIAEFRRGYEESSIVIHGEITRKYASKHASEADFREVAPHQALPVEPRREMKRAEWLRWHRSTALLLIPPWIRNLALFGDPSHGLFEECDESLRSAIRCLIDVTVCDTEMSRIILQHIWAEVAKLDSRIVSGAVVDELLQAASHAGCNSPTCDAIADIFGVMSCLSVRAKLLVKVRQTLAVVTGPESEDSTWNDLGTLAKLLAASLFNVRAPIQSQVLVPETCHSIAMLALMGSEHVRGAVAGIMTNLIQALLASRIDDSEVADRLKALLMRCCGPEVLRCFGLMRIAPDGNEYRVVRVSEIDSIETICDILLEAIVLGAPSTGLSNAWRSRWMSLTASTTFQPMPFTRARALLVMGKLCPEGIDEDLFFQLIVAFGPALHSLEANDERVAVNLLRCIQKIAPSLIRSPRGPYVILWVPTCLLHVGLVSVFNEAARLLRVMLDSLYAAPDVGVRSVVEVFAQARAPQQIEEKLRNIDLKIGLTFSSTNFSFSMGHTLFRGMRVLETEEATEQLLRTFLRLSDKPPPRERPRPVSEHSLGFFLALLPTCRTKAALVDLVRASGGSSSWAFEAEGDPERPRLQFRALGVLDEDTAILVVTFLIGILETAEAEWEQEMLFHLLAEASQAYPNVTTLASDAMLEIVTSAFNEWSNRDIMTHAATISTIATRNDNWGPSTSGNNNPEASATAESASVHPSEVRSMVSPRSLYASREHFRRLEEVGMTGMLDRHQLVPRETSLVIVAWISSVVDGILKLF